MLPPHHHEFQHVHKRFPTRHHDGHASLARETRRDPVDVDTDLASMVWTNWDLAKEGEAKVKTEKVVFKSLRPATRHVIELDTPSPSGNPSNSMLGLPDEEDTLEQALEHEMELALDELDNFPKVGMAPEEGTP